MSQPQHHLRLQQPPPAATSSTPPDTSREAPPKQVAMAMERLGQAARLIADVRISADRILEALYSAAEGRLSIQPLQLIAQEGTGMRQHLQDLRSVGQKLEETGVLNDALRSRINSWGLHMPLVCPDGAVVAYAWKRQLAGQAGASAVDRTRLALKSFKDQKRRFFPHLDSESDLKRHRSTSIPAIENQEECNDDKSLIDMLRHLDKEVPDMKVSVYERLGWLKQASMLHSSVNDDVIEVSVGHNYHGADKLRAGSLDAVPGDRIAVIELFVPSTFRAIISLHPVGSTTPDAVAFFSPDEGGRYVHPRGISVNHTYRHITEYANMALQYFHGVTMETALQHLLEWIGSYQTLFSKPCSKCGRVLALDTQLMVFLPPIHRSYRQICTNRTSTQTTDQRVKNVEAYHTSCSPEGV